MSKIFNAVRNNDIEQVQQLINQPDFNINNISESGMTVLMKASNLGYTEIVQLLIENNANVNCRSESEGTTALMFAVDRGRLDIARLLINSGADVNAEDRLRNTALTLAYEHNYLEIIQLLEQVN